MWTVTLKILPRRWIQIWIVDYDISLGLMNVITKSNELFIRLGGGRSVAVNSSAKERCGDLAGDDWYWPAFGVFDRWQLGLSLLLTWKASLAPCGHAFLFLFLFSSLYFLCFVCLLIYARFTMWLDWSISDQITNTLDPNTPIPKAGLIVIDLL